MRSSVAAVLVSLLATGCGRKPLAMNLDEVDAALAVRPRSSVVIVSQSTQTTTPPPVVPAPSGQPAPPPMSGDPRPDANMGVAPARRIPDAAPPPTIPDATAAAAPVTPPPPDAPPPPEMSDLQARYMPMIRDVDAQAASLRAAVSQAGTRASGTLHSQVAQVVDLRNRLVDEMNRGVDDRTLDQHAEDLRRALDAANESARRELSF
jgi:hypothetical protein